MEMTITWPPAPWDPVTPKCARQGQPTRVREPEKGNRPTPQKCNKTNPDQRTPQAPSPPEKKQSAQISKSSKRKTIIPQCWNTLPPSKVYCRPEALFPAIALPSYKQVVCLSTMHSVLITKLKISFLYPQFIKRLKISFGPCFLTTCHWSHNTPFPNSFSVTAYHIKTRPYLPSKHNFESTLKQRWSSMFINAASALIFGWKWKLSRRVFIDVVLTLTKQRWNNINRTTSIQRRCPNVVSTLIVCWKWNLSQLKFIGVASTFRKRHLNNFINCCTNVH